MTKLIKHYVTLLLIIQVVLLLGAAALLSKDLLKLNITVLMLYGVSLVIVCAVYDAIKYYTKGLMPYDI